ncbi:hypothetical protein [Pandoraea apista]|uniref:Uncharacterized protein n=1 Tax=Pandoraea apista TaxID=93218 RepID=A0A0B5F3N5_9BURK|nr:hypothetical protein [Pandoraea apista]AJE97950.1 hypothetical protein SG18_06760 [Pandoraea apista]AKH71948.1 hypothetical protein XM39_06775 [Pandoraea apista]AKI64223.1 hypothetical protein AA956_24085 [Pandoraea apista]ALS66651.1 hypothetical protein AT395_18175 [Pandoraea apista]AVF38514.1 hypothetical protein AL486_01365 [Pandoraea apista]
MFNAIADWINSKTAFVLALLLALAGLTLGLGHAAATLAGNHGEARQRGADGGICGEVQAWFGPQASLAELNDFLTQYGAVVTYGPNENGAWQLHFPALSLDDALQATSRANGVARVAANSQCRA